MRNEMLRGRVLRYMYAFRLSRCGTRVAVCQQHFAKRHLTQSRNDENDFSFFSLSFLLPLSLFLPPPPFFFVPTRLFASNSIKSRAYVVDEQPVLVLIRGDSEVNETKLKNVLNAQQDVQMATDEQVESMFHSVAGFMGPFDLPETVKIVADSSLKGLCNGVTGANQKDLHWQNVN